MPYSRWTPGCCCGGSVSDCNSLCSYRSVSGHYEFYPNEIIHDDPVVENVRYRRDPLDKNYVAALVGNTSMRWYSSGAGAITDPNFIPYSSTNCPDQLEYNIYLDSLGDISKDYADYKKWVFQLEFWYESGLAQSWSQGELLWKKVSDLNNEIYYYIDYNDSQNLMGMPTFEIHDDSGDIKSNTEIFYGPVITTFHPVIAHGRSSGIKTSVEYPTGLGIINYGFDVQYNISVISYVLSSDKSKKSYIREENITNLEEWQDYLESAAEKTIKFGKDIILDNYSMVSSWKYVRHYPCMYATMTNRKWLKNGSCKIVECRCPLALEVGEHLEGGHFLSGPRLTDGPELSGNNMIYNGWRYYLDEYGEPVIDDADHVDVRSVYCNSYNCQYYSPPDFTSPCYSYEIPKKNE